MTFDPTSVKPEELTDAVRELAERQQQLADIPVPESQEIEVQTDFRVELADAPQVTEPNAEAGEAPQVEEPEEPDEQRETPTFEPIVLPEVPDEVVDETAEPAAFEPIVLPEAPEVEDPEQAALLQQTRVMLESAVDAINERLAQQAEQPKAKAPKQSDVLEQVRGMLVPLVEAVNDRFSEQTEEAEPQKRESIVPGVNEALTDLHGQIATIREALSTVASETNEALAATRESLESVVGAVRDAVQPKPTQAPKQLAEYVKAFQDVAVPTPPADDMGFGDAFADIDSELDRTRPPHVTADGIDVYNDGHSIGLVARSAGPFGLDDVDGILSPVEIFTFHAHFSGQRNADDSAYTWTFAEIPIGQYCHVIVRLEGRQCDGNGVQSSHPLKTAPVALANSGRNGGAEANEFGVWGGNDNLYWEGGNAEWTSLSWVLFETDNTVQRADSASSWVVNGMRVQVSFAQTEGYMSLRIYSNRDVPEFAVADYSFMLAGTVEVIRHQPFADPHSPPDDVEGGNCCCHDLYRTFDWNSRPWGDVP